ncbi:UvrD-helicase domain-containing protein [Roseomonas marmotae]|uniref:UvrD-helicase domain-containing protein n=1 Tax=Roseomonas marmotae TaxID=2768161 RepID=UPI001AD62E97|nr:UvrD-helicase domain-containing protein [Roseomonas marmotae]QTI78334.1 UvrD-helicase domain-containing protein [Roseomonas marmotae]
MDAVELARQRAAQLHEAVVPGCTDPWNVYALAVAAAARHGIDVEPVQAGGAILSGGKAHFDPVERAIRHEDSGSAFDQAFLVGHEIGHALLGDDQISHVTHEVDPARSAEAAPVGEDRVVDYSRRQRREIQMDLFGRELLLPRSRARDLHLEGMTATQIAERLGAPFDVVAQQLLDALLLPAIDPAQASPPSSPPKPLNDEQRAAAGHRGAPYLLEAGPGTGKTQTLIGRVASLVDEGVDPRTILVLTFSNKAAGELSDRIATVKPDAAPAMWVGTFHAFGLDLVRRFHRELGFACEPRLMDRTEAVALLEAEYLSLELNHYQELWDPSRPLRDMLAAVSRAKDEVADVDRFEALALTMRAAAVDPGAIEAAERCREVATVYRRYEELKKAAGTVDFGDLVSLPVTLLDEMPSVADRIRGAYTNVLVDEYQDVNRSSVRLLQHLTEGGRGLWAVGDGRQAIYRFRGASSYNMARFASDDFPGASSGRLRINYRSTPEIVTAFSTFGAGMAVGTGEATLCAHRRSSGVPPEHVTFGNNDDEAGALADEILALAPAVGFRSQAVLCPGNERLARLGRELERRNIPVLYLGNLFERPEVKDLLSLVSLLVDKRAMALVRKPVLDGLHVGLSLAGAAAVIDALRRADAAPLTWKGFAETISELGFEDRAALRRLGEIVEGFGTKDRPWLVLAKVLLDRTRVAALLSAPDDAAKRAMGVAVWQLMSFLRTDRHGPGVPVQGLLDRIRRLVQLADDRDLRQLPLAAQGIDAVRLMTIHGSKGLEFPVVHVMGLNKNGMPSAARRPACPVPDGMIEGGQGGTVAIAATDHAAEQECLFYVAASRARDRLLLYSASYDAGGKTRSPSKFIAGLGRIHSRSARSNPNLYPDPEGGALPIQIGPPVVVTTAQLDLYTRCPRRFLYTHILGVGGRRSPTTLSRVHDLVRQVVEDVVSLEPAGDLTERAEALLAQRWAVDPLAGPEYRLHREVALLLVRRFTNVRGSGQRVETGSFQLVIGDDVLTAKADDVLATPGGHVARIIRTGHGKSEAGKELADAAFQMAVSKILPGCKVEILHLSDHSPVVEVSFDRRKLESRHEKLKATLAAIGSGQFRPEQSDRTCPSCPTFFICGPLAAGSLKKNL